MCRSARYAPAARSSTITKACPGNHESCHSRGVGTDMEKVAGIGGLFFRARDPAALGQWYMEHLGVTLTPSSYDELPWLQEAGPTAFSPFPEASDYFGNSKQMWMVNFRVRDLDAMA